MIFEVPSPCLSVGGAKCQKLSKAFETYNSKTTLYLRTKSLQHLEAHCHCHHSSQWHSGTNWSYNPHLHPESSLATWRWVIYMQFNSVGPKEICLLKKHWNPHKKKVLVWEYFFRAFECLNFSSSGVSILLTSYICKSKQMSVWSCKVTSTDDEKQIQFSKWTSIIY